LDYLVDWEDEVNLSGFRVLLSLINANNELNDLLIAFIEVNVASKHRLFEPYLKSTLNELVRDLLSNWSQKLNDLSLDGICFILH